MDNALTYKIEINAPVAKVWQTMLEKETYEEWVTVFSPDSQATYEGVWEQGAPMKFLDADGNGMNAVIAELRPHEYVSIKHLAMIMDGAETAFPEPGYENYTFTAAGDGTELLVELLGMNEYKDMFDDMWPKALEKLKELCEA